MARICQWLGFAIFAYVNVVITIVGKLFDWIPGFYTLFSILMGIMFSHSPGALQRRRRKFDKETARHIFTFTSLKRRLFTKYIDVLKTAEVGDKAPNTHVLELVYDEMKHPCKERRLLDYQNDARPLVVLFGNITCPIIRDSAPEIGKMKRKYTNCDFIQVYTSESHAKDEWYTGSGPIINKHKTQLDKLDAAQMMVQQDAGLPVVCDMIDNESERAYGAANCRVYVIRNGILEFSTGVGPMAFDTDRVRKWLEDYSSQSTMKKYREGTTVISSRVERTMRLARNT